jgi:uncharacterized protein YndB with AHSA1/START domain
VDDDFISGPVTAQAEIMIAADEREVWAVLADIDGWPVWNPAILEATLHDDLEVGRRFRYATTFGAMRCRLREVDGPRALAWSSRMLTMAHRQTWTIRPVPGGCEVTTRASLSGIGAWLFKARLDPRLQGELAAVVQLLKLETEARISEVTPGAGEWQMHG